MSENEIGLFSSSSPNLLDLSDEILLMIIENLSTKDILNLYKSCKRLKRICLEKKLWINIEEPPDNFEALKLVLGICQKFYPPSRLKFSSKCDPNNRAYRSGFSHSLLSKFCSGISTSIITQNLTHLYLIKQKIDGRVFKIDKFPKNVKVLDLSGTLMTNITEESHYFRNISEGLKCLEDLDLTDCSWATSHSLMALSKCEKLNRLCVKGIRNMGNCIAYTTLAARFGFKKLKILDATNSNFGSTELTSFATLPTIEKAYFGQYDVYNESANGHDIYSITDHCVDALRSNPSLQVLDLSGSKLSDYSLNIFKNFKKLERLDLYFCTNVTENGVQLFKKANPNCIVNY